MRFFFSFPITSRNDNISGKGGAFSFIQHTSSRLVMALYEAERKFDDTKYNLQQRTYYTHTEKNKSHINLKTKFKNINADKYNKNKFTPTNVSFLSTVK